MQLNSQRLKAISSQIDWNRPQWAILDQMFSLVKDSQLWAQNFRVGRFERQDAVSLVEKIQGTPVFWFERDVIGPRRFTSIDYYGLVGLSAFNLGVRTAILTEGVSDFLTMKMCYPNDNILGFTTLGGNIKSTKILLTLADRIFLIGDNDSGKERNTGILNVMHLKEVYESYGKEVKVWVPEAPYKDVTEKIFDTLKRLL